tara:strand:+ start:2098 stop:2577 length:480 start_codon:yes stop_codon:yes gene_type:complete
MSSEELNFKEEQNKAEVRHRHESTGSFFLNKCNTLLTVAILIIAVEGVFWGGLLQTLDSEKLSTVEMQQQIDEQQSQIDRQNGTIKMLELCIADYKNAKTHDEQREMFADIIEHLPEHSKTEWDRFVKAIRKDKEKTLNHLKNKNNTNENTKNSNALIQ